MADNVHAGHRERMRSKFIRYGADVFDTYELLEMFLYYTVPVKDTNPIAKELLQRFRGIDGVLHAKKEELRLIPDVGERTALLLLHAEEICKLPVLYSVSDSNAVLNDRKKICEYLIRLFAEKNEQSIVMLSLDNELRLLHTDEIYHYQFSSAAVKPEEFVRVAIRRGASAVVVAHNQFGGIPFAKDGDHETERLLRSRMKIAGIEYPAHFIISGDSVYEFPHEKNMLSLNQAAASCLRSGEKYGGNTFHVPTKESGFERVLREYLFSLLLIPFGEEIASESAQRIASALHTASHVFELPPSEMVRKTGVQESVAVCLRLLLELYLRVTTDAFHFGRVHSDGEIDRYLTARFLGKAEENILLVCLDSAGRTVACELINAGSVNASQLIPRQVLTIADTHEATTVILAHNHPSGSIKASLDDRLLTNDLRNFLQSFGITLRRHGIFAGFRYADVEAT